VGVLEDLVIELLRMTMTHIERAEEAWQICFSDPGGLVVWTPKPPAGRFSGLGLKTLLEFLWELEATCGVSLQSLHRGKAKS